MVKEKDLTIKTKGELNQIADLKRQIAEKDKQLAQQKQLLGKFPKAITLDTLAARLKTSGHSLEVQEDILRKAN